MILLNKFISPNNYIYESRNARGLVIITRAWFYISDTPAPYILGSWSFKCFKKNKARARNITNIANYIIFNEARDMFATDVNLKRVTLLWQVGAHFQWLEIRSAIIRFYMDTINADHAHMEKLRKYI